MKFLHFGFKVHDIEKASAAYRELFGLEWEPIQEFTLPTRIGTQNGETQSKVTHAWTDDGVEIELVQTVSGPSVDDAVMGSREGISISPSLWIASPPRVRWPRQGGRASSVKVLRHVPPGSSFTTSAWPGPSCNSWNCTKDRVEVYAFGCAGWHVIFASSASDDLSQKDSHDGKRAAIIGGECFGAGPGQRWKLASCGRSRRSQE